MFCSRHSSGGADELVLSTVLGTSDSGPSALFGITEYEMLLCRGLFTLDDIEDVLKDKWIVSEQILTPFLVNQ